MMRAAMLLLCAASACAGAADLAANPAVAPVETAAVQGRAAAFTKPVTLRGTLGEQQVQLSVRPKAVADEGLEGSYFVFGRSASILVAGDVEGDALFLEESENGTDISGHWEGRLQGDAVSGTWTAADGEITRPFTLRVMAPDTKSASSRNASARTTK